MIRLNNEQPDNKFDPDEVKIDVDNFFKTATKEDVEQLVKEAKENPQFILPKDFKISPPLNDDINESLS